MFDINDEVYMAGEAGADPDARWEGYIAAGPYDIKYYGEPSYTVVWDRWTGGGEFEEFHDVRADSMLVAIMEEGE
jgi:hypothetical protein